eukprot:747543-Hanusia_phi.AAC.2
MRAPRRRTTVKPGSRSCVKAAQTLCRVDVADSDPDGIRLESKEKWQERILKSYPRLELVEVLPVLHCQARPPAFHLLLQRGQPGQVLQGEGRAGGYS